MSSPAADHPAQRPALSSSPTNTDSRAICRQLQFVRSADIDACVDELARLLKSTIRRAVPTRDGGITLPVPEDLVQREVSTAASVDGSHVETVADSALIDAVGPPGRPGRCG